MAAPGLILFIMVAPLMGLIRGVLSQEIIAPRRRGTTSGILFLGLDQHGLAYSAILGMIPFGRSMYPNALSGLHSAVFIFAYVRLSSARSLVPGHRSLQIHPSMPSPSPLYRSGEGMEGSKFLWLHNYRQPQLNISCCGRDIG